MVHSHRPLLDRRQRPRPRAHCRGDFPTRSLKRMGMRIHDDSPSSPDPLGRRQNDGRAANHTTGPALLRSERCWAPQHPRGKPDTLRPLQRPFTPDWHCPIRHRCNRTASVAKNSGASSRIRSHLVRQPIEASANLHNILSGGGSVKHFPVCPTWPPLGDVLHRDDPKNQLRSTECLWSRQDCGPRAPTTDIDPITVF